MKVLMLTLQNDSPTLETNAERKDQYKAYGKSFRTLIKDCLQVIYSLTFPLKNTSFQKDPTKRPTATELLKYSFFKKSKDKKHLVHTLIENLSAVPVISHPGNPTKKVASGKLRKDKDGNWEFEYDSPAGSESSDEEQEVGTATASATPVAPINPGDDVTLNLVGVFRIFCTYETTGSPCQESAT